jgi:hypothetical protein
MTREKLGQSAPSNDGNGRWRLNRLLGKLGFGLHKPNKKGHRTISSTVRTPVKNLKGSSTRDKKDAFHLRTSAKDSSLKNIPNNSGTDLLMFSGISGCRSTAPTSSSLDCGETASTSYSEEKDDDWMMAPPTVAALGKDDSFDSLATDFSSSASTQEGVQKEDDDDFQSFCSCEEKRELLPLPSSPSIRLVRFADEEGLPMEEVCQWTKADEDDVLDRNHYEELLVLCLSPQHKRFEFLHVGYFPQANLDELRRATNVEDLLHGIPCMATDPLFQDSAFDALYRATKGGALERIPVGCTLLRDCNFRTNELVVASMEGSQHEDLLQGLGPLLGNSRLMKRVRRGQKSGLGLKLVSDDGDDENPKTKRRTSRRRSSRRSRTNVSRDSSPTSTSCTEDLIEGYGNEVERCNPELIDHREYEGTESTRGKLFQAAFMITAGTIVFSAIGI